MRKIDGISIIFQYQPSKVFYKKYFYIWKNTILLICILFAILKIIYLYLNYLFKYKL